MSLFKSIISIVSKSLLTLLIGIGLAIGIVIMLYWQTNAVSMAVEKRLNEKLNPDIEIQYKSISGSLFHTVNISQLDITIKDKFKIGLSGAHLVYDVWPLIHKQIRISEIRLDSVVVDQLGMEVNKTKSTFNLDSLLARLQKGRFVDKILDRLPDIKIDALEVLMKTVRLVGTDREFENILIRFNLRGTKDRLNINVEHLAADWPARQLSVRDFGFHLIAERGHLVLNKFKLYTANSHLELTADVELGQVPRFIVTFDDFLFNGLDLATFSADSILTKSLLHGETVIIGEPLDFNIESHFSGTAGARRLENLTLKAGYDHGLIKVDTLSVNSTAGKLSLSGLVRNLRQASGSIRIEKFDIHQFMPSLARSEINGTLSFSIPEISVRKPRVHSVLVAHSCSYDVFSMDSLRIELDSKDGALYLAQPSFVRLTDQAEFSIYGRLSAKRELDVRITALNGQLDKLGKSVGIDSLEGSFYTNFRAFGKLSDPDISGELVTRNFKYGAVTLDSLSLDFFFNNLLSKPSGGGRFNINNGNVYDTPVNDVYIYAIFEGGIISIPEAQIYSGPNFVQTSLDIISKPDSMAININELKMAYQDYVLSNKTDIHFVQKSEMLSLKGFNLYGPQNTVLLASGSYNLYNTAGSLDLGLNHIALEPFQRFLDPQSVTSGVVSGKVKLSLRDSIPDAQIKLSGTDLVFVDAPLGMMDADISFHKDSLSINRFTSRYQNALISAKGDLNLALTKNLGQIYELIRQTRTNLDLNWSNIDLSNYNKLLRIKKPLKGRIGGYLSISGDLGEPLMKQSLRMRNFTYQNFKIDSLVMFGQYNSGYMILDSLSADINGTSFNARGWQQIDLGVDARDSSLADNPLDFYINSKDDQLAFLGLLNPQIESISGPYELALEITGTPGKPAIASGYIHLDDGTILLSRVKDPIKNVTLNADIEDNIMTIHKFHGKSEKKKDFLEKSYSYLSFLWSWMLPGEKEKGIMDISGTIGLADLNRPKLNLNIKTRKFYVDYFVENARLLLNTDNLSIKGQDTLYISGILGIPGGEFIVDLTQMAKNANLNKPSSKAGPPFTDVNLQIDVPGNFVVRNAGFDLSNNFRIAMGGNLRAIIEAGSNRMLLTGVLETKSGKFSTLNQSFNVVSGTIDFTNPLRINPDLNILTERKSDGKIFELTIMGNLDHIRQDIRVIDQKSGEELALSEQEKLTLLSLGADLSTMGNNTGSAVRGVGEDVATNSLLTAAERGVENVTGLDKVEISSSDKLLDLEKLKLNNGLAQASISFGKYLTSDLYVEYRTNFGSNVPTPKLSWDAGNRIGLEYRINHFWSLKSYYEKTVPLGNNKVQLGLSWKYSF